MKLTQIALLLTTTMTTQLAFAATPPKIPCPNVGTVKAAALTDIKFNADKTTGQALMDSAPNTPAGYIGVIGVVKISTSPKTTKAQLLSQANKTLSQTTAQEQAYASSVTFHGITSYFCSYAPTNMPPGNISPTAAGYVVAYYTQQK